MEQLADWVWLPVVVLVVGLLWNLGRVLLSPWLRDRWERGVLQDAASLLDSSNTVVADLLRTWPDRKAWATAEAYARSRPVDLTRRVRGIGPKTLANLRAAGIETLGEACDLGLDARGVGEELHQGILALHGTVRGAALSDLNAGRLTWSSPRVEREFADELATLRTREAQLRQDEGTLHRLFAETEARGLRSESALRRIEPALQAGLLAAASPTRLARIAAVLIVVSATTYALTLITTLVAVDQPQLGPELGPLIALVSATTVLAYHLLLADVPIRIGRPPNAASLPEQRLQLEVLLLAEKAGIAPPRLVVVDDDSVNASARGSAISGGLVVVHTGLLQHMTEREVVAVLGHEVSHLWHGDLRHLRTQGFAEALLGGLAVALGAVAAAAGAFAAGTLAVRLGRGKAAQQAALIQLAIAALAGAVALVFAVAWLVARVAGSTSRLLGMVAQREAEFGADRGASVLLGDSAPMVQALRRLESGPQVLPPAKHPRSTLFHVPRGGEGLAALDGLFSSHPPTAARIANLESPASRGLTLLSTALRTVVVVACSVGLVVGAQVASAEVHQALATAQENGEAVAVSDGRRCPLWVETPEGASATGGVYPSQIVERIAVGPKSTHVRLVDGREGWLVNACMEAW